MKKQQRFGGEAIDRKEFMSMLAMAGAGTCTCGAVAGARLGLATEPVVDGQENKPVATPQTKPGDKGPARAAKRMEFVEVWLRRFFNVMDAELAEPTRRKIMVANGRVCFSEFQPKLQRRAQPATQEEIAAFVAGRGKSSGYSMEGDAIFFEYVGSAETGQAAPEGTCLCPVAEAQRAREISPTFCWCSVGYVKEMHERVFGRPVRVDLLESVLMGHPRCRFRITPA
jgi:hypothetical protein